MTHHYSNLPKRRLFLRIAGLFFVMFVMRFNPLLSVSQSQELSQEMVRQSVVGIAAAVNENYFDIKLAARIQKDLRSGLGNGDFGGIGDIQSPQKLADSVTARLMELTQDKHLVVTPRKQEPAESKERLAVEAKKREEMARAEARAVQGRLANFGVQKFEVLPGNIAYLSFTSFYRDNEIRDLLAAQMKLAANADAVVLDMRFNAGGSTGAISLLSSYFFEGPKRKLFDVVARSGASESFSTDPTVQNRNENRPVYVLVQASTFSAGEGLAFVMQDQKRAVVIGETTAGAANPGRPYYVNQWFEVNVPNGQVKVANGGGNWEGTGVTPDVEADDRDALLIARRMALKKLLQLEKDESYKAQLSNFLNELN